MGRTTQTTPPEAEGDDVLELPERYHAPECPMNDDRLEWHTTTATTGKHAGLKVEIIRCPDCGGQIERPATE